MSGFLREINIMLKPRLIDDIETAFQDSKIIKIPNGYDGWHIQCCRYDFTLRGSHGVYECKNLHADCDLFIEQYCVKSGEVRIIQEKSVFIHAGSGENCFCFSFDAENESMWKMSAADKGVQIKAEKLKQLYPQSGGAEAGIDEVSFKIKPSEFVGLYGQSGGGKSVLIEKILEPKYHTIWIVRFFKKILGKIIKNKEKTGGTIKINDRDPYYSINKISYLPQQINLPKHLTCIEVLRIAAADRIGQSASAVSQLIDEKLTLCGLEFEIKNRRCSKLSGGQVRRLSLAMALLKKETKLLILDEPTSGLDVDSELTVMRTLRRISRSGITVIAITHSIAALNLFDRVLMLHKKAPNKGSQLIYNGSWSKVKEKDGNLTDEKLLQRMLGPDSALFCSQKNSSGQDDADWPFSDEATLVTRDKSSLKATIKNCLSPTLYFQFREWFRAARRIAFRDGKNLTTFVLLAICCVIAIHWGVSQDTNAEMQQVVMLALAAPWLCATYAVVFTSELLKFHAWEKFSGQVRSFSVVAGIFLSLFRPSAIIALIFTLGMFFAPNKEIIFNWLLRIDMVAEYVANKDKNVVAEISKSDEWNKVKEAEKALQEAENKNEKEKASKRLEDARDNLKKHKIDFIRTERGLKNNKKKLNEIKEKIAKKEKKLNEIKEEIAKEKELMSEGKYYTQLLPKIWEYIRKSPEHHYSEYSTIKIPQEALGASHFLTNFSVFILEWGFVIIICQTGAILGVAAAAFFRNLKSALLFVIVLFIIYLLFSSLFMKDDPKVFLCPLQEFSINEGLCLKLCYWPYAPLPILLSFFCIGRYAVNLLCYQTQYGCWGDALALLGIIFIAFMIAVKSFSNSKKNWAELKR